MFVIVFAAVVVGLAAAIDLEEIEQEIERNINLELLKDYFKFHLYVNPHPICALEDESCTLDNNCCRGLECKVAVDRGGVRYACQQRVAENATDTTDEEVTNEDDVRWGFEGKVNEKSDESTNSFLRDIYRDRLEKAKKEEERLLNDRYYLIKELKKPLTLEEMIELQHEKELEDYKREKELMELRKWAIKREMEKAESKQKEDMMKQVAQDRVNRVLKEEERQKMEMFRKVQEAMKQEIQKKLNKI